MSQSFIPDKECGKKYQIPQVHVIDIDFRSVICASVGDTEDYNIMDIWDIPDQDDLPLII